MERKISTFTVASAALAMGMASMQMTSAAQEPAGNMIVDCDAGQSIQTAVNKANPRAPLALVVSGTCEENVLITRDDVTIDGKNDGAVSGMIEVSEGRRVIIQNLCISKDCPNRISSRR